MSLAQARAIRAAETERLLAPPGNSVTRALAIFARARIHGRPPFELVGEAWPDDLATMHIVTRAASDIATIADVDGVAQTIVADLFDALTPASAGAALFRQALTLSFDRAAAIVVPTFAPMPGAGFIAERAPIPAYVGSASLATLEPHKLAAIVSLTREMIESSNAERLIGDAASKAMGPALDAVLFDADPATPARPAGLRFGIAATPPTSLTDRDKMLGDLSALADAVAPVASNALIVYIASPGRAQRIRVRLAVRASTEHDAGLVILASSSIGDDLICVATNALVSAAASAPEVEMARVAALQMETTPDAELLAQPPVRSLWQTDSVAMKVRWPLSWALRDPRGVAWIDGTQPIPW